MELQTWLKSEVEYGEELVQSAIAGARSAGEKVLAAECLGTVLGRSTWTSLPWATVGASIGVLASSWGSKRHSPRRAVLFGLLGAALGFGATVAVSTRHLTEETVRGAVRNVNTVRDAHWLAKNTIDYA